MLLITRVVAFWGNPYILTITKCISHFRVMCLLLEAWEMIKLKNSTCLGLTIILLGAAADLTGPGPDVLDDDVLVCTDDVDARLERQKNLVKHSFYHHMFTF